MIIDLQRRIQEVGRIRIGALVATTTGKKRPAKLATFRLTSPDKVRIDAAAAAYGGTPRQWDAPSGQQWEVITDTDELAVVVPPSEMAFSQWYETWSAGGCQRRCDGVTELISDQPCLCDPDNRECDIHSRLSVMLTDLAGLGVWRLDTSGYYAAVELAGAVTVIATAAGQGSMLPARLRITQRQVKRPGEPRRDFVVPTLDVEITPRDLFALAGAGRQLAVTSGDEGELPVLLTPVPESVPSGPVAPIAEQATMEGEKPRRSNALPVPESGLEPRTIAEVAGEVAGPEDVGGELRGLLDESVGASDTMIVIEGKLRRLYSLMAAADF